MIESKCDHSWRQFKNADSESQALYECTKCKSWLTAADAYQLEALQDLVGPQKYLAILAIAISVIALLK